jgi:hypothetical protein
MAAIEEIAIEAADLFEEFGINLNARLKLVIPQRNAFPDGESSVAFEFHFQVNEGIFAFFKGEAPQFVQLYVHAFDELIASGMLGKYSLPKSPTKSRANFGRFAGQPD